VNGLSEGCAEPDAKHPEIREAYRGNKGLYSGDIESEEEPLEYFQNRFLKRYSQWKTLLRMPL
jgi:hypothetical protein